MIERSNDVCTQYIIKVALCIKITNKIRPRGDIKQAARK